MPFTALNGRLPDSLLTGLPWLEAAGFRLRIDAAASAGRLAAAFYVHFAAPLHLTDAYRTFASQVELKDRKGVWAATPGTSNHGLGIAIDFASGINVDGSVQHLWMVANAGRFGWVNPTWATDWNPSNGQHEPWHWEYHPELDITPAAIPARPAITTTTPTWEDDEMISPEGIKQVTDIVRAEINRANPLFIRSANGRVVMVTPKGVRGVAPTVWTDWNNLGHRPAPGLEAVNNAAFDRIVASLGGQVN